MKKALYLLLVLSLLLPFTGCNKNDSNNDPTNITSSDLETTYIEKPSTGRPKSQEPINNIFIALSVLNEANYYKSQSSGTVEAKKAVTLATQSVKSRRMITPSSAFSESISVSSFVKVAEQLYTKDETILKRDASNVSSSSVSWSSNVSSMSEESYLQSYGYAFDAPSRYIINEKTIISDIEIVNNGIGRKFTYKFNLDPSIAPYYYKKSVKKLSGSSNNPAFKSIQITMTFDYKWRMQRIETNEIYEIEMPVLGKVTCYANLTEQFSQIDKRFTFDEENFFNSKL